MADEASAVGGRRRPPYPWLALLFVGAAYVVLLLFTSLLTSYRFPSPYVVPIFDGPFAILAIGVAYLCLERHRLRHDARSAWLGITLWVTALVAVAHIATQPDYPGTSGTAEGIAPYFFFLTYLGSFVGLGLAARADDRFLLNDRGRALAAIGGVGGAVLLILAVVNTHAALPALITSAGRFTPVAVGTAGLVLGTAALWAIGGAQRRCYGDAPDGFSRLSLLAGLIWGFALLGLLASPYRYGAAWYVAGFARPVGVALLFIALMREQVWLYREARRRVRALEILRNFGQALLQTTTEREIVAAAAHTTRELTRADMTGVYCADQDKTTLRLEAGLGWQPGIVGDVGMAASEDSLAGYAYLHREPVHVEHFAVDGRFIVPSYLTAHGVRAGIVVPLGLADQPLGVVAAFYRTPRPASDDEQRVLASVADQTALALEKARLHTELQESNVQLHETQDQLIQADKLKALGALLSGMAHELNNPLSTIQLSVQLVKRTGLDERDRRRLAMVEDECERASRIVRDLLLFARRKPPERKSTDLNRVLTGVLKLQSPDFDLHRIRVVTGLAPLPPIMADAHQLQQVFLNLCTNARQAIQSAGDDGTLTVRSMQRDQEVVVQIEDTGPGIPVAHFGRIFDPFFTTKSTSEGTGLGLSLSIGIVQAHGGRLEAINLPEHGARFTVALPIGTPAAEPSPPAPRAATNGLAHHARVLVVDDETLLRNTVGEVLTTLGHTVKTTGTGREALALVAREGFDVVTLDLRLPDLDGKTVWRTMHAQNPELAARVIFLTGDTMSPDTQKFLEEAQRPVLTKPLTIDRISDAIQQMLTK